MDQYGRSGQPPLIDQLLAPFRTFAKVEAGSGILLLAATVLALAWSNSPWAQSYFTFFHTTVTVGFGPAMLAKPLLLWINDGLMAVFFFTVGLEIKREILVGELNSPRRAVLPVAAALGGMLVPAGIYTLCNQGGGPGGDGWAIPMATDIAFALGILSLLGDRVPSGLKVFLTAVAIVDDIGAILVIALFYTADISLTALAVGGLAWLVLLGLNAIGVRHVVPYLLVGLVLWLAFLKSGVHATVAGVLGALAIPASTRIDCGAFVRTARSVIATFERAVSPVCNPLTNTHQLEAIEEMENACHKAGTPLQRLEHGLHPVVAFGIMPLFALANAGVPLGRGLSDIFGHPVPLGILLGLVVGKQLGVFAACALVLRLGLSPRQEGVGLLHYYGAGWLAAIGFTMSIFIAGLAFPGAETLQAMAKGAILVAALVAGLGGSLLLRLAGRQQATTA